VISNVGSELEQLVRVAEDERVDEGAEVEDDAWEDVDVDVDVVRVVTVGTADERANKEKAAAVPAKELKNILPKAYNDNDQDQRRWCSRSPEDLMVSIAQEN
jgi:hypothetical protein